MSTTRLPIIVTVLAASVWGLYWLPLRAFEDNGLTGGWTTLAVFATPTLLLAPLALWRMAQGRSGGVESAVTGLLVGGSVALYSESLLHTDVARALILFYVTPVWSTLLEVTVLRQSRKRPVCLL